MCCMSVLCVIAVITYVFGSTVRRNTHMLLHTYVFVITYVFGSTVITYVFGSTVTHMLLHSLSFSISFSQQRERERERKRLAIHVLCVSHSCHVLFWDRLWRQQHLCFYLVKFICFFYVSQKSLQVNNICVLCVDNICVWAIQHMCDRQNICVFTRKKETVDNICVVCLTLESTSE